VKRKIEERIAVGNGPSAGFAILRDGVGMKTKNALWELGWTPGGRWKTVATGPRVSERHIEKMSAS